MGAESRRNAAARTAASQEQREALIELLQGAMPYHHHNLIDAYGRRVAVGGRYAYTPQLPIAGTVVDIAPVMEPQAPPGLFQITLQVGVVVQAYSRVPVPELIILNMPPKIEDLLGAASSQADGHADPPQTPAESQHSTAEPAEPERTAPEPANRVTESGILLP